MSIEEMLDRAECWHAQRTAFDLLPNISRTRSPTAQISTLVGEPLYLLLSLRGWHDGGAL